MTATTAIYILGKTHKLNPHSAISHIGNTQHYIQYSEDLCKANFYVVLKMFSYENKLHLLFWTSYYDWKV